MGPDGGAGWPDGQMGHLAGATWGDSHDAKHRTDFSASIAAPVKGFFLSFDFNSRMVALWQESEAERDRGGLGACGKRSVTHCPT